jgi:UDP-sugar transporter A1/2/3
VPAVLYVIQNSLVYIALSNLSAPVFLSLYQAKLITAAIVSVFMLKRYYTVQQWACLITLAMGVAIVALDEEKNKHGNRKNHHHHTVADETFQEGTQNVRDTVEEEAAATDDTIVIPSEQYFGVGLLAVTGACFCSAFAGVYFENVLAPEKAATQTAKQKKNTKSNANSSGEGSSTSTPATMPSSSSEHNNNNSPPSLWIRNLQLSFCSIIIACLQFMYDEMKTEQEDDRDVTDHEDTPKNNPFLHGFTFWVWILVTQQALGGLLVAAVLKYADNVIKGIASAMSIVLSTLLSTVIFETPLTGQFVLGAATILMGSYCFSNDLPPLLLQTRCKNMPL